MSEYVVGVDEVGRGSLVGSTIICAFRSQNSLFDKLPFSVSDSKKINKKKREEIYEYFRLNKGFDYNYQIIFGKGIWVINLPPFLINFFSFLKISFLKFHAPRKI